MGDEVELGEETRVRHHLERVGGRTAIWTMPMACSGAVGPPWTAATSTRSPN
jgi:hypothetical protein